MRKKCIAIAKKAMVWTLAASMLVATPLTASAAGLRGVYKVEDGWGNVTDPSDDTRTGTVTTTNSSTYTGVLKDDGKLTGIVLDETEVQMEMVGAYQAGSQVLAGLTVTFEGGLSEEEKEDLKKHLTWKSGDLSVVALNNRIDANGNPKTPNGDLGQMTLVAKGGGKTTVTVSLDDHENNIHYTTTANVSVKQFATGLDFSSDLDDDAYAGVSLNLNDYLEKTPETANDEITYTIVDGGNYATLKNDVLKLKTNAADKVVTVVALGEYTKSEPYPITVRKANPATKVEIVQGYESTTALKNYDWLVNDKGQEQSEFHAVLTPKTSGEPCTDKVTWSSKKSDIVTVEGGKNVPAEEEVTLVANQVGKTTITVQASSGKKATLNVTVRANMTGFQIEVENTSLYSGQIVKLGSNQEYADEGKDNFTETALAWAIEGETLAETKAMKKVASIDSKGVLKIKPDIKDVTKIRVSATNAKAIGKNSEETGYRKAKTMPKQYVNFDLTQLDITSITVYSNMLSDTPIVTSTSNGSKIENKKGPDQSISVGTNKTYRVVATAMIDGKESTTLNGEPNGIPVASVLSWVSSNDKLATATSDGNGNGTVTAVKKGKPTISINGSAKKGNSYKAIKATFKANVTVPTKSIVLSTKNKGIAATNRNQTITVKATLEKGTTSKAKDIKWSAVKVDKDGNRSPVADADIKNGKLKVKKDDYVAGDKYIVTARLPEASVQSSIILNVVKQSDKVEIRVADGTTGVSYPVPDANMFEIHAFVKVKGTDSFVDPGVDDVADVTYTMDKKGIVQMVGNEVTPIKKGTVKITATTSDGKKATLKVIVN